MFVVAIIVGLAWRRGMQRNDVKTTSCKKI